MNELIIDSALTFEEALEGKVVPEDIRATLTLLDVLHYSFDGNVHKGQILVHSSVAGEVEEIFASLYDLRFPIEKMLPVNKYNWDDNASMADNNSSSFNYRFIFGTETLSNHARGLAIDINPVQNPYTQSDGVIVPLGAVYDPTKMGTITADGSVVPLFTERGWKWGGTWEVRKDWQHFEKP